MDAPRKILLTTSRNPTPRIRTFCNDLTRVIPSVVRVNRGKMSTNQVAEKALEHGADRVVLVDRWQGGPGKIEFFLMGASGLVPVPLSLFIVGIRLQREFAPIRLKPFNSLVIMKPVNNLMEIADSLSKFFKVPVLSENEALAKYPVAMHVSLDSTRRVQITFMLLSQKVEIGPRITLRRAAWEASK